MPRQGDTGTRQDKNKGRKFTRQDKSMTEVRTFCLPKLDELLRVPLVLSLQPRLCRASSSKIRKGQDKHKNKRKTKDKKIRNTQTQITNKTSR
jgi:hypothetical protein